MKKGTGYQQKVKHQMGSAVLQEHRMKKKSAKSMLRSAYGNWGASKLAKAGQNLRGGVISAEWKQGTPIQEKEHRWGLRRALRAKEGWTGERWVSSVVSIIWALVGIEKFPSQAE